MGCRLDSAERGGCVPGGRRGDVYGAETCACFREYDGGSGRGGSDWFACGSGAVGRGTALDGNGETDCGEAARCGFEQGHVRACTGCRRKLRHFGGAVHGKPGGPSSWGRPCYGGGAKEHNGRGRGHHSRADACAAARRCRRRLRCEKVQKAPFHWKVCPGSAGSWARSESASQRLGPDCPRVVRQAHLRGSLSGIATWRWWWMRMLSMPSPIWHRC